MRTVSQLAELDPRRTTGRPGWYDGTEISDRIRGVRQRAWTTSPRKVGGDESLDRAGEIRSVLEPNGEIFAAVLNGVRARPNSVSERLDLEVTFDIEFPTDTESFARGVRHAERIGRQIGELAQLVPNHDRDGASAVTDDAIQAARWLCEHLYWLRGILVDTVTPLADGGVELEYENSWMYFDLWVFGRATVKFVVSRGGSSEHGEGPVFEIPDLLWKAIGRQTSCHQSG